MNTVDTRKSKFIDSLSPGGIKKGDNTLLVTGGPNLNRRGSAQDVKPAEQAPRGVLNGAMARSRALRQQARKAALQNAVDNLKFKSHRDTLNLEEIGIQPDSRSQRSICSDQEDEKVDTEDDGLDKDEAEGGGFMNVFRTAVQRAYDSVGDPEKEGVNQEDITDILSKLGYSSEDRETQNILTAAANMTDKSNMQFQDIFKLVVGKNEEETLADITNAFEIFDRDDDGRLQTKELHRALTRIGDDPLTEEEFQEIIYLAELDPDFEAFFDYKELTNHKLALSYASTAKKKSSSVKPTKRSGLLSKWNKVPQDLTQMLKK